MYIQTEYELFNLELFKALYTSEMPKEEDSEEKIYVLTGDDNRGETEIFGVLLTTENAMDALKKVGRDLRDGKAVSNVISEDI